MEQRLSSETNSPSACQEIPAFCGTSRFITEFTCLYPEPDQSNPAPSYLLYLIYFNIILPFFGRLVKVKVSVFLIEHYALKANGGVEVLLQGFLTSARDAGRWSACHPGGFTQRIKSPAI
jgi:hypothetical protein